MQFDDAESPIEVRAQIASIIAVCRTHSDRFIYFVYNLHEAGAPVHNSQQLSCTARTAEINARDYRARQSRIFLIKLIGLIAGALTHVVSVVVRSVGVDVVAHLLHKNTHTDTHCRLEGSGLGEAQRLNINGRYFERIAHYTCAYSTLGWVCGGYGWGILATNDRAQRRTRASLAVADLQVNVYRK